MLKTKGSTIISSTDTEKKAEYLRVLSQCAYNVKVIIDIHSVEKLAYRKELEHFYVLEKERLPDILNNPTGVIPFQFEREVLKNDLLADDCRSQEEIENTRLAKKKLTTLLSQIETERRKDPNYKAKIGLEEGLLKYYLLNLIDQGEKDYPKSLLEGHKILANNTKKRRPVPIDSKNIQILEILEDRTENEKITIYINNHYFNPIHILRGIYGRIMYKIAKDGSANYVRGFLDYFNTNKNNKLYTTGGYKVTKIFKQEYDSIKPTDNIKINLITQNKVTRILTP